MAVQDSPAGGTHLVAPDNRVSMINDPKVRGLFFQILTVVAVVGLAYMFAMNAQANLRAQGIATGLGFLNQAAGFDINQTLIEYNQNATYGRVLLVGLMNTLLVAAVGIVMATIIGFTMGIARLSTNWMIRTLGTVYVEATRNLPPLFQIFFWYVVLVKASPSPRDSISGFGAVFFNNRGLYIPRTIYGEGSIAIGIALIAAIALSIITFVWARRRQNATGQQFPMFWTALGLLIGLPLLAAIAVGFPVTFEMPQLRGFNFVGGTRVIPEFVALVWALSLYTAGFIAEIVRAGIMAVSHGQTEASYSIGLRPGPTLRLVVIPQALRVIIPPLTSQYLNLTKNSSLAVAIGYPELTAIFAGTTLNQTGQAIEVITITMGIYLFISIVTSFFMNWYNRRVALIER